MFEIDPKGENYHLDLCIDEIRDLKVKKEILLEACFETLHFIDTYPDKTNFKQLSLKKKIEEAIQKVQQD
jgi:hypothetical protein